MKTAKRIARLSGLGLVCLVLLSGRPSHAGYVTYPDERIRRGSDIMMKDHRWPRWDSGTYYAIWYSAFHPKSEGRHSFYGGVPTRGPRGKPGMFWNFWGDTKGIHQGPQFYATGHGAEGASGAAAGKPDFLRTNAWYRFVMRVFPSKKKGEVGKNSCVAWWVKDLENDTWHMHSMVRLPGAPKGFSHNRGFVEALAAGNVRRSIDRRLGYGRIDGEWYKTDTVGCAERDRFMLIENDTVLRYDSAVKEAGGRTSWTTKQPDAPPLDAPEIADAAASVWRNQVRVEWSVPRNASPQLGYRIEVFDNTRARGEAMVSADDNAPYMLSRRFDTPRPARCVRLTVVDIFDQEKTVVLRARPIALGPRATTGKVRQGLLYKFYTARGRDGWTKLPAFAATTPDKTGTVTELDDTVRENRRENYAIQYAGYVKAPADGLYVISAGTCDGSRLRVDGKQVYEYDGIHSAGIRQHPLALSEGLHRLELDYFKGPKAYPHVKVDMSWEGPGFERRPFVRDDFVCGDAGDLPMLSLEVKTPVAGGTLVDNLAEIHAIPELRGHRLAKIEVFVGRLLLGTTKELDRDGRAVFTSVLPKGDNRVWARLWYDGNNSVNADRDLRLSVRNRAEGPWTFSLLGPDINPLGGRYEDGE
ncbi:MAG: PA14 domain-containing protein, partial [Planctomycetota bacterium]